MAGQKLYKREVSKESRMTEEYQEERRVSGEGGEERREQRENRGKREERESDKREMYFLLHHPLQTGGSHGC